MRDDEIRLNVADLIVSLSVGPGVHLLGHVDSFLADEQPQATVNIRFSDESDRAGEWHEVSTGEDFGWNALEATDGESVLVKRLGGDMQVRFAPEPECQVVDVLLGRSGNESGREGAPGRELLLVEALPLPVVVLLSGRGGVFLHSCAVALNGEGILFAGVSGSGKSTMADLWRRFGPHGSRVIDDEHIIARNSMESVLLYGAPWSRGPRKAIFSRTPARAIFFLSHGELNRCDPLSPAEAFAQLLSQAFLPVWSQEQVEQTVGTCVELLEQVDCYRLWFVPDSGVVDFVQDVLGGIR